MILFLKNILHQKCIKSVTGFMKNVVFMIKLLLWWYGSAHRVSKRIWLFILPVS